MEKAKGFPEPRDHFYYQDQQLTVDGISLAELASKYGTPLYVYSGKAIRDAHANLKNALGDLPVQICFAVKANSNLHILKLLNQLGVGCDLVSYGEWQRAELANIPRNLRVLSGVAKTKAELEALFAFEGCGVHSIHIESLMEFHQLGEIATEKKQKIRIAFRYNPDVDAQTHEKISTGRKQDKFGLTRDEILSAVQAASEYPYTKIAGLSIHIGSQITKLEPYEAAFSKLKQLQGEVELLLNRKLDYLDLGGGLGVRYADEKTLNLNSYAGLIRKYFLDTPKILIEPGRCLIANAGALVSELVVSKIRTGHQTLILDAGMNDLLRPALYEAHHDIAELKLTDGPASEWDVVGGICETTDYFTRGRKLRSQGEAGEKFAILSAGAYGFSMSSTYNSRPKCAEVLVDQGQVKLIRRRETFEDMVNQE